MPTKIHWHSIYTPPEFAQNFEDRLNEFLFLNPITQLNSETGSLEPVLFKFNGMMMVDDSRQELHLILKPAEEN